jgi:hypothetical protein
MKLLGALVVPFVLRSLVALQSFTAALAPDSATGQTIQPPYDAVYTLADLGEVPRLPSPYGGLTFLPGNSNLIVIGGSANTSDGAFYSIGVVRNALGQITAFSGTAAFFSDGQFNDGGAVFGPGDVLFYTRFPTNEVGQVKPGSILTDKIINLTDLGVNESVGALNFVPEGLPGAGQLKIVSYPTGDWYATSYATDGTGTYDLISATLTTAIPGFEAFVYVPVSSPILPDDSMIVAEYGHDVVSIYQFDANGNPNPASRSVFIDAFPGVLGAVTDPLTGDVLFSVFRRSDRVIVVRGFAPIDTVDRNAPVMITPRDGRPRVLQPRD